MNLTTNTKESLWVKLGIVDKKKRIDAKRIVYFHTFSFLFLLLVFFFFRKEKSSWLGKRIDVKCLCKTFFCFEVENLGWLSSKIRIRWSIQVFPFLFFIKMNDFFCFFLRKKLSNFAKSDGKRGWFYIIFFQKYLFTFYFIFIFLEGPTRVCMN